MPVSVFDLFSIGVGPSSSHTVGPMRAGVDFAGRVVGLPVTSIRVDLYGSLASTGHGHGTLGAVAIGLMGHRPEDIDPDVMTAALEGLESSGLLTLAGGPTVAFRLADIVLHPLTMLPRHPNAMRLRSFDATGTETAVETYYSIGGGFIARDGDEEPGEDVAGTAIPVETDAVPHPFSSGAELLAACATTGLPVSGVALANETATRPEAEVRDRLLRIHAVMEDCVDRSVRRTGTLPGGLEVRRRAADWFEQLTRDDPGHDPLFAMEWTNLTAMAVNEENASGGRVVTAPTNGAAGIIPAVLFYALTYVPTITPDRRDDAIVRFLLTAGAVGSIYKERASISGAEVGCQGEVGSAASMAAAGLAELLGGTPEQVENAAEIAMEHNLGLTCDPVGGLVQIPCIERNAIAANKAVNAARMALRGDGVHHVSLDQVVETMRQTGADMSHKYKETAMGGLAVNVPLC
ncbi:MULTISPECIES: L-serine ammonia-lyase [unclassified Curtobacterium]|uniref:L-serine ammonia-lyase n=1 Tax=unclassified Curtobacterium TaxID=257496 RepID=UPI000D9B7A6D|nr:MULTISPECIES: L-serine ammonia-lyase [unclassified Curtobacterium]PYY34301.1 L-serine ammonia-lyase [Curtobacterium sp. MCBD17_030]PZE37576.1 L-serine ammonia-lyase [Curtobacterium sp. MCPF17_031]PZF15444.1 L-serine ammonia-lyase [Curtobacterium sp. MCPF17_011]